MRRPQKIDAFSVVIVAVCLRDIQADDVLFAMLTSSLRADSGEYGVVRLNPSQMTSYENQ
jgi:hypothetical protein